MGSIERSRARHPGAALVVVLSGLSLCAVAHADDYETELLGGVAARDRALETQDERDWQQALLHLERAVALQSTAEAEFEFAEVAARLRLWAEAYSAYEAALALGIDGLAEARAREFLGTHAAVVARLGLSGPAGAAVVVDERRRGALPLVRPLAVSAGTVVVRIEQSGFRTWERQLTLSSGSLTPIAAHLVPDGSLAETAGPPTAFGDVPEPPAQWAKPMLIGGGSVFLLGSAGILVTSVLLPDARADLRSHCDKGFDDAGNCTGVLEANKDAAQSAANRVLTLETLRWVGVGGAIVGLAGAALGFFELQSHAAPSATAGQLELQIDSGSLGIQYGGRF